VAVDGSASLSFVLPLPCSFCATRLSSGRTTWLSTCLPNLSETMACTCFCPCTAFDELSPWNCNFGFGAGWLGSFPFSLAQVICDLTNLNLHLGNRLGVHHGGILHFTNRLCVHQGDILHFINGLACKLHEGLERVL
jgi:hypothetical protein